MALRMNLKKKKKIKFDPKDNIPENKEKVDGKGKVLPGTSEEPPIVNDNPFPETSEEPPIVNDNPFPETSEEPPIVNDNPFPETDDDSGEILDFEIDPEIPYFFVFGNSTAGKSAMLSGLLYYLKTGKIGQLFPSGEDDEENQKRGKFVLNRMINFVKKGKFVPGTATLGGNEFPAEIHLDFKPSQKNKPKIPFCLLEMAGEDLKEIILTNSGRSGGTFDKRINAYLEHPECDLNFICVLDVDAPDDSEELIDEFINYTQKKGHGETPILISINKFDKVRTEYKDVEEYFKDKLPILSSSIEDYDREFTILDFSIGEVDESNNKFIYNPKDSKRLFNWIYEIAAGVPLDDPPKEPSPFSKFINFFKNILSK